MTKPINERRGWMLSEKDRSDESREDGLRKQEWWEQRRWIMDELFYYNIKYRYIFQDNI